MSSTSRATQLGAFGFAGLAVICGAVAAFLVARVVNAKGYSGDKVVPVVVAKHNLPAAQPLTEADVEVVNWPEKHVPAGVASDTKSLFAGGKALIPTQGILEGEPIVPGRLATSGAGTGIAALVHEGSRAMAIRVDESVRRSGLVYPGASVDVVVTMRDQQGHTLTRVAVGDARVLAVEEETDVQTRRLRESGDSTVSEGSQQKTGTVVTIEVSPDDIQVIGQAQNEGHIDLALRNGSDRGAASTKIVVPIQFSDVEPDTLELPPGISPPSALNPPPPGGGAAIPLPPGAKVNPKGVPAAVPGKPGDPKRIELRAVDNNGKNPDKPEIETYHAR